MSATLGGAKTPDSPVGRWFYAFKPASWPKLLVPAFFGQVLGMDPNRGLDLPAFAWGLAFTVLGLGFIVLLNDWGDREVDTVKRTMFPDGGSPKTIPDQILGSRAVGLAGLSLGVVTLLVAAGAEVALGRRFAFEAGLACMLVFVAYTLPPIRLNYRGGGELLEMVGVGAALPLYNAYLQGGAIAPRAGLWLAGFVALVTGFIYGKRTEPGRKVIDWLKIHSPIVGTMFRKVTISRGIRTLGTMLASGVPVMDSLKLASEVSGNYYYEKLWEKVLDEVAGGKRICEVLAGDPLFPRVLVQMIACGEETAKLDIVLEKVSTYYDHEVETTLKATTSIIEPIMISVMGIVVGTIGLALLLPIFSLSKQP